MKYIIEERDDGFFCHPLLILAGLGIKRFHCIMNGANTRGGGGGVPSITKYGANTQGGGGSIHYQVWSKHPGGFDPLTRMPKEVT